MKLSLFAGEAGAAATDLLVIAVSENDLSKNPVVKAADRALGGALMAAAGEQGFKGEAKQQLVLHTLGKMKAKRVALIGLGKSAASSAALVHFGGSSVRIGNDTGAKKMLVVAPAQHEEQARAVELIARGAVLGGYRYTEYKSKNDRPPTVAELAISAAGAKKDGAAGLERAAIVAESICLVRDLVNQSPLQLYPETLAARAVTEAKSVGLKAKLFAPAELEKMGMNLLLGVGQGSSRGPRLVHLSYAPKRAKKGQKPIVLVGKGITFDSGGLSLKDPPNMMDMKSDMAGAAAVLGAMKAVARLAPSVPVEGIMALAENMPSGTAIRPGDVIKSAAGKSVEINNTDAEGRLVLADALHYARSLEPARIIDLATLTGACIVALGPHTVGMFANDDALAVDILTAAGQSGEDFWRMPLTPALKEQLQSDVADMKNTGERWGGAIVAALFLSEFAGGAPWAHLDIAGPATSTKEAGATVKGGTGVGVATLVELITA